MKKIMFLLVSVCLLSSCSVFMAAKKSGTSLSQIQVARTRASVITAGGTLVESGSNENGDIVGSYRFQKETGSPARALMHGLLDVSTLGVWEVVGTPMEGLMGQDDFYIVKFTFDKNDNVIRSELL